MGQPVLDRLADARRDAGHARQHPVDAATDLFALVAGQHGDLDLAVADRLCVLVAFGAAGAPDHGAHADQLGQLPLDPGRHPVALRERRARRRHQEHREGALVERRQEARAEGRGDPERARGQQRGRGQQRAAALHRPVQRRPVGTLERAHQPAVAAFVAAADLAQQEPAHHRRHGQRGHQRRQGRDDVRDAERAEEPPFEALQEQQRHEDHHDDGGREHDRAADLVAGRVGDRQHAAALLGRQRGVLAEPPEDVLDVDDRVVDELPDRDGEAAEGHHVDRHAGCPERHEGDREAERQGRQRDQRRPPLEQEQHQDDRDEDRRVAQHREQVVDAQLDEVCLPHHVRVDADACGHRLARGVQLPVDGFGQGERVGARRLLHGEHDRAPTAFCCGAARRRGAELHVGDVAERHGVPVDDAHDRPAHVLDAADAAGLPHGQLEAADVGQVARPRGRVRAAGGLDDVLQRQVVELQVVLAHVHLVLRELAAERDDLRDARHRHQLVAQVELRVGAEVHRRHGAVGRRDGHQHDLAGDRRDRGDLRVGVVRQQLPRGAELLADQRARAVDVLPPVELDPEQREADRARAADAAHRREAAHGRLQRQRDRLLDLVCGQPRTLGQDHDRRRVELGEDVDGHARRQVAADADHEQGERHDHERPLQGERDQAAEH